MRIAHNSEARSKHRVADVYTVESVEGPRAKGLKLVCSARCAASSMQNQYISHYLLQSSESRWDNVALMSCICSAYSVLFTVFRWLDFSTADPLARAAD